MPGITSERAADGPPRTVGDWFRQMRIAVSPAVWLSGLLVVSVGAYHLVWLFSDRPYSRVTLAAVSVWLLVGALLALLGRSDGLAVRAGMRTLLVLAGLAALVLGSALLYGVAEARDPALVEVSAAGLFACGSYVIFAGVYLRGDDNHPRSIPQPVSEQRLSIAGAEALLRRYRDFGAGATDRIVDICKPVIAPTDLHFVAYFVNHSCRFYLDVLDDPKLSRFFDNATPDGRRDQYVEHGYYLDRLLTGLNRSFLKIDSGILIRVVLDVERGALYYYWLDEHRYLIGVTLNQEMVDKADRKMVHLVDGIRESLGHKKIGDLDR